MFFKNQSVDGLKLIMQNILEIVHVQLANKEYSDKLKLDLVWIEDAVKGSHAHLSKKTST